MKTSNLLNLTTTEGFILNFELLIKVYHLFDAKVFFRTN